MMFYQLGVVVISSLMTFSSSFIARPVYRIHVKTNNHCGVKSTTTTSLEATALIIQNKGGGHGELGYQVAKKLLSDESGSISIDSITILQDDACKDAQEPFKSYATDLPTVNIIKAKLSDESMTESDLQSLLGENIKFDYIWDNASKEPMGAGKACIDCAKNWNVQLYVYVSSAGIYQPNDETTFPMSETTPVKAKAGQVLFENYAIEQGLPLVSFRPQYIYGEKANKFDYMYVLSHC
jgi:nucleoside-diphosphate-sugar epimerase